MLSPRRFTIVCALFVSGLLVSTGACVRAAEPGADAPRPAAAALVERVIADEAKIDHVASIYLKFEGKWTRPLPALARHMAKVQRNRPNDAIDVDRDSNFWPEMTEELEIAFDKRRVRSFTHLHKSTWNLRVFDGELAVAHEKTFTQLQEHYTLAGSPHELFYHALSSDLSWLRMGPHRFWFQQDGSTADEQMQANGYPRDYAYIDDADYRGRACYVVENRRAARRLYIGKDDRRLYGILRFVMPRSVDALPSMKQAAGREFAITDEAAAWAKQLPEAERKAYLDRLQVAMFAVMRPWVEYRLDDYREIAPGFWLPATQGYTLLDSELTDSPVEVSRELHLVKAAVDKPLDDKLFTIPLANGVQVYDTRYEVPLFYVQKGRWTPEEWQQLIDDHKDKDADWKRQQAARDALIGQPAPELPEATWLNAPPMSLAALKGKVVILDFWATTCGPCRNDLPIAEAIHRSSDKTGVVVIGVHAADGEPDDVKAFAKEQGLTYPIVIDRPPPQKYTAFGLLSSQLKVRGIPYSFVIDQEGKIAGHGPLREMQRKAEELAARGKK